MAAISTQVGNDMPVSRPIIGKNPVLMPGAIPFPPYRYGISPTLRGNMCLMVSWPGVVSSLILAIFPCMACGQAKSVRLVRSSRVSGRISDSNSVPVRNAIVTLETCHISDPSTSQTGQGGSFSLSSVPPNEVCDLYVEVGTSRTWAAQVEVVNGVSLDLGNLVLGTPAKFQPAGRLTGSVTVADPKPSGDVVAIVIGADGINIISNDGKVFFEPKDKEQTGYGSPRISADRTTFGWLLETYCCASYPVSPAVVVHRSGRPLRMFRGDGRAIFDWRFVDGSRQVAFYQDSLHGNPYPYYELRDVETDQLIDKWEGAITATPPKWTVGLRH
jgi:hypothetical protein